MDNAAPLTCRFCRHPSLMKRLWGKTAHFLECTRCGARGPRVPLSRAPELPYPVPADTDLLRTMLDESPDIMFITDRAGCFLLCNRALARLYGTTPDQLIGKSEAELSSDREVSSPEDIPAIIRAGVARVVHETRIDTSTGKPRHFQSIKKPLKGADGEDMVLVIGHDITQRRHIQQRLEQAQRELEVTNERLEQLVSERTLALEKANAELKSMAFRDPLTGIGNRVMLEAWLSQQPMEAPITVLMLDLDHFKLINDRFGHKVGDQALVAVASCLANNTRRDDLLVRWGGEEFLLILKNVEGSQATRVAENLRQKVEQISLLPDQEPMTVSIGLVACKVSEFDMAMSMADEALYQAKKAGRNRTITVASRKPGA